MHLLALLLDTFCKDSQNIQESSSRLIDGPTKKRTNLNEDGVTEVGHTSNAQVLVGMDYAAAQLLRNYNWSFINNRTTFYQTGRKKDRDIDLVEDNLG